jgi:nucleotide-binding universal stress UspA family protein
MFKHLLVTLDGSPRAESVILHATDIAKAMGAEITLLRVVDSAYADWGERGAIGRSRASTTVTSPHVEQAAAYLERVASQLRQSGISARTIVKQGEAAKEIIATAKEEGADAITIATHSRHGINRLMFGSVAEEVLHASHVPILVVRAA